MTCAEGGKDRRQVIQFRVLAELSGLQGIQGVCKKHNAMRGVDAVLDVGCCCFQGFCFGFVVSRGEAGSEADSVFSVSRVLDKIPAPPF